MKPAIYTKWQRPTGLEPAVYEVFSSMRLEKLAWEFLRRNKTFQTDCLSVRSGAADADSVATKWHLFRLKDYELEFGAGGAPRFLPTLVRCFANHTGDAVIKRIKLEPGHVAFVFNASAALHSNQAKSAQKKRFSRWLDRRLDQLAAVSAPLRDQFQPKRINYGACLQALDLLHSHGPTVPSEFKLTVPSMAPEERRVDELGPRPRAPLEGKAGAEERAALSHSWYVLKKQATEFAERRYLELAIVGGARRKKRKPKTAIGDVA